MLTKIMVFFGFTSLNVENCYPLRDQRDSVVECIYVYIAFHVECQIDHSRNYKKLKYGNIVIIKIPSISNVLANKSWKFELIF